MRAGPRGPSGVKPMFRPARAARINCRNAASPPRVDDPRADSTPYRAYTRTMYSPSFDCELIVMIGLRNRQWSISSRCACQKAMMY